MNINHETVLQIIKNALAEDIQHGDITTNSIVPIEAKASAFIHVKQDGIIAGLKVAEMVFKVLDPNCQVEFYKEDGEKVLKEDVAAKIEGSARSILTAERTALNLMQRMSGIATFTAQLVEQLTYYNIKLVDTRKTAPGLRILDKYAVKVGGANNHRFGLYDGVLIKDNHIQVAGGIKQAVSLVRQNIPHVMKIEVEVESLAGVEEALAARADVIMLDNMCLEDIEKALQVIDGQALVEVSGGITSDRIAALAKLGVDLISVGAITHSPKALDISLDLGQIKVR